MFQTYKFNMSGDERRIDSQEKAIFIVNIFYLYFTYSISRTMTPRSTDSLLLLALLLEEGEDQQLRQVRTCGLCLLVSD